ncbi:hypothetical protein PMIN03_005505 [Paraphaeosphaeria minitans]
MASDDLEAQEYVFSKELVGALHKTTMEPLNNTEAVWFPVSPYPHSLWQVISDSQGGLSDHYMTRARNFFSHAVCNPGGRNNKEEDYSYLEGVLQVHERILPAVKEVRDKIKDALNDAEAWTPEPNQVSDRPAYAIDCLEAEAARQQWLATQPRPNGETDRQLENYRSGLVKSPSHEQQSNGTNVGEEAVLRPSQEIWGGYQDFPNEPKKKMKDHFNSLWRLACEAKIMRKVTRVPRLQKAFSTREDMVLVIKESSEEAQTWATEQWMTEGSTAEDWTVKETITAKTITSESIKEEMATEGWFAWNTKDIS